MKTKQLIFSISFLLPIIAAASGVCGETLPWDVAALSNPPQVYPATEFTGDGVTGVFYEGLSYQGKPTRVFSWYGIPENRGGGDSKLPAMILVHGGGGTAFQEWVHLWTGRGYAAIAMDTCGCVPRGSYGQWERHAWGGPPGWGGFESVDAPIGDQWSCHAVADILLAHSLIRTFPEVDPKRIGITGISWGGYLTCIAAGVDNRLQLAVPVYGCGFLGENSTWLDVFEKMGAEKAGRWLSLWDPSVYLPRAKLPMLWVTGANDFAYPMDSLQRSYRLPQGERTLCIRIRMPHGHGGAGENPAEILAFSEQVFRGASPLPRIIAQGREGNQAWLTYQSSSSELKAELLYTCNRGAWQERNWESMPATLDPHAKRVEVSLPERTVVYYINLTDAEGHAVSSEHETLP